MSELDFIDRIVKADCNQLREKAKTYGDSWKKSGGRSAWFMLKRKIDRLVNMLECKPTNLESAIAQHDIFEQIKLDPTNKDGTVISEIRDLRCYLLLVEAEMMRQGVFGDSTEEKDDESLHAKFDPKKEFVKYDPVAEVEKLKKELPHASRYGTGEVHYGKRLTGGL